ncbi:C2H2 finger domain protein [Arthroderma uncinatum]|uniref:C2H2 finger domain protein n=1 Tax=Arthroderma uncinatum TaxID=74035 RepID=UPI00144AD899|nr:C2H2 finger domain protein [Arthroderma uncinatum]KAF3492426.1 C2H2 finger domain protein [Arthroderma uncinatum]
MFKSAMSTLLVTFGEIRCWKGAFHAHQFRYGSGKVINESEWVSKGQHMLIMKHASPRTFLDHYHPLQLDTNIIQVIYNLNPNEGLIQARAQIEDHPKLEDARCSLSQIRAQYAKTQQPALLPRTQQREKEVRNTRKRLHRSLRYQIRENFDEEQAFLDIEALLSGTLVKEEIEGGSSLEDTMHPLQLHLVQSLLSYPISNSSEDEWNRRDMGAAAVVQYCDVLEGSPLRGWPKRKVSESTTSAIPIHQPQDAGKTQNVSNSCEGLVSVAGKPSRTTKEYLENPEKPEACFQCFANTGLRDHVRFQMYHKAGCVTHHF